MAGQRLLNVDAFIGKDGRHRTHLALNKASIGFPEWTMDFFIAEPLEEQNIIKIALLNMLLFLYLETSNQP